MAKKRARNQMLSLTVRHILSEAEPDDTVERLAIRERNAGEQCDADGHFYHVSMGPAGGDCLASILLRKGMSAATAALILRKAASHVEKNGNSLMNLTVIV